MTIVQMMALGGVVVAGLGPVMARLGVPPMVALAVSVTGAFIGLAGAVGLLATGGPPTMAIVALVPFVAFSFFWLGHRNYPVMNDLTTDTEDPPAFAAADKLGPNAGRDMSYPPVNSAMQKEHYPKLLPLRTKAVPNVVFEKAKQAGEDLGWEVHSIDAAAGTYEAVETVGQFRFRDDVSIRVRVVDGITVMDVRAKARVGRADFGMGARHIADLLAAVRARLPQELLLENS